MWKTDLPGPGSSSPIVSKGRVFITCWSGYGMLDPVNPGDMSKLQRHALCLDRRDGKILWSHPVPAAPDTPYTGPYLPQGGYASHSPVSDSTNVFFFLASPARSPSRMRARNYGAQTPARTTTIGAPAPRPC